jgi:hypothetical protein
VPLVAEFDAWREREREVARERGNGALQRPSAGPDRKRWGTWEQAMLHFGYSAGKSPSDSTSLKTTRSGLRPQRRLGGMFDHVGIAVADLAASERFYRTVLSVLGTEPSHADADSSSGTTGPSGRRTASIR